MPGPPPGLDGLATLVQSKRITAALATDPWGTRLQWQRSSGSHRPGVREMKITSAGPDARWSTTDDLTAGPFTLVIPRLKRQNCFTGRGGGGSFGYGSHRSRSPKVFMSRASVSGGLTGGNPTWGGARGEPRVRRTFKETLLVLPGLRTDDQGRATIRTTLADNITTWVVSALANDAEGRLGGAVSHVLVSQPFYVDVRLPPVLTRTDEITVPVVVHNDQPHAATVTLELRGSAWVRPVRKPTFTLGLVPGPAGPLLQRTLTTTRTSKRILIVPPRSVRSTRFRIRALQVGRGSLTVKARAGAMADAIRRSVLVQPEGMLDKDGFSGLLKGAVARSMTLPTGFVPGSQRLEVSVEPSLIATSTGSLESLLRQPYGCMEQSSAITYPNILVLRHLRGKRGSVRARRRAQRYLTEGYQKLLGFEVSGGGFSLYGSAPADLSLTALGLAQLTDMAAVRYVDRRLIARTRRYLLRRLGRSGSWKPEGYLDLGGGDPLGRRYVITAYIAWMLARSGAHGERLEPALDFLRTHLYLVRDNAYAVALAANATLAAKRPRFRALERRLVQRLIALRSRSRKGRTFWRPPTGRRTVFSGLGQAAGQETTALALMALERASAGGAHLLSATTYLLESRDTGGAWATTRATVLALQALLAIKSLRTGKRPREVQVLLDGRPRGTIRLPRGGDMAVHTLDLSAGLAAGRHQVQLVPVGKGAVLFRIGLRYHRVVIAPKPAPGAPSIRVRYSSRTLRPDQSIWVFAELTNPHKREMVAPMVELGLPPGFDPLPQDLERLSFSGGVERYEVQPGRLLVYFTSLSKGTKRLGFRLRARYPLRARIPASRFYEYYRSERQALSPAQVIEVRGAQAPTIGLLDLFR